MVQTVVEECCLRVVCFRIAVCCCGPIPQLALPHCAHLTFFVVLIVVEVRTHAAHVGSLEGPRSSVRVSGRTRRRCARPGWCKESQLNVILDELPFHLSFLIWYLVVYPLGLSLVFCRFLFTEPTWTVCRAQDGGTALDIAIHWKQKDVADYLTKVVRGSAV